MEIKPLFPRQLRYLTVEEIAAAPPTPACQMDNATQFPKTGIEPHTTVKTVMDLGRAIVDSGTDID